MSQLILRTFGLPRTLAIFDACKPLMLDERRGFVAPVTQQWRSETTVILAKERIHLDCEAQKSMHFRFGLPRGSSTPGRK